GIRYSIPMPESIAHASLTMERRRDFWLVFKEMVTNAVRHSECSEVAIVLAVKNSQLHLSVEDNGKGFDPTKPTERNGVKNIYQRSAVLKGEARLTTAPGKGTRWDLTIPLRDYMNT
ncbi:MAG: ATP-binding protein, partial [Bacteroidota bacterium]